MTVNPAANIPLAYRGVKEPTFNVNILIRIGDAPQFTAESFNIRWVLGISNFLNWLK